MASPGPLAALPAAAQSYPSRNITAIIPFAAGNANDVTARIVFEQLQKQLGQPIVIESKPRRRRHHRRRPGRRSATPDGYTVLFHSATFSASYVTHKSLPYDTLNDFTAVSAVGISPSVLVASPSKGYKTAADLVAAAKAKSGQAQLRFGGHRRGVASCGREIQHRRRHQGAARSVQGPGRGAGRGDGGTDRLLFPAARGGDRADQGRQGHGAGGVLRQARAATAGCSDHGRDRLSGRGLRVLERRVRAGEDAAGHRRQALSGNPEGDRRSERQGAAGQGRRRSRW